jgi:integrase
MPALTKRIVDAAKPTDSEFFVWCSSTPGFGLRVYRSGKRVFVCQVRVGRATRRVKIGVYGPYTVDQARQRAQEIIRAAAEGRDPQREKVDLRNAITVGEMCDKYLKAASANLVMTRFGQPKGKPTLKIDEGRIARHIKPLIGSLRARDVTQSDVQRMADAVSEGRTGGVFKGKPRGKAVVTGGAVAATRTVGLLGGIYAWAEKRNLVPGPNPAHGIETARCIAKERTLSVTELAALGKSLNEATASPNAAAPVYLIALTGMRREEACGLRWSEIDWAGSCVRLEGTKTGRSVRPLGRAALELLRSVPRSSEQWVFPNRTGTGSADLKKSIAAFFDAAGIHDARSHDLRRTFASIAADEGYSDSSIGDLLGHARRGVIARHYIRRPDAALVGAADRVSARIVRALQGSSDEAQVVFLRSAQEVA